MTREDFESWRDQPATQWFMRMLEAKAAEIRTQASDRVFDSQGLSILEWAGMQAPIAHERGRWRELEAVISMRYEDIADDD